MAATPAHVRRAAAALHATACLQPTRPTDVRIQLWSFRDIPSGRARLVRVIKGRSTDRQLFDLVDLVTVAQLFSMPPSVVWLDPVGAVEELDPRLAVGRIAAESLLSIDGALVRQRVRTTARGAVDEPGATTDPLPIDVRSWERARLAVSADANDVLDELIDLMGDSQKARGDLDSALAPDRLPPLPRHPSAVALTGTLIVRDQQPSRGWVVDGAVLHRAHRTVEGWVAGCLEVPDGHPASHLARATTCSPEQWIGRPPMLLDPAGSAP